MQGGTLRVAAIPGFLFGSTSTQGPTIHSALLVDPQGLITDGPGIESDGGVVVLDPDVELLRSNRRSSVPFTATSQFIVEEVPMVRPDFSTFRLDRAMSVAVHGAPGAPAVLAVSVPGAPTPFGDLWLDARFGSTIPVAFGVLDAAGEMQATIDLSAVVRPGNALVWQAALVEQGQLKLSTPWPTVLNLLF